MEYLRPLEEQERGTLVLWEVLDRIITLGFGEQAFLDLIDRVEQHLAMVFHRDLQGPNPRMRILINERAVTPGNPFLTDHPATWSSPAQRYPSGTGVVEVQGYVLPHRDRLESGDYERAGGPEGWTAQQGFYVYRNQRLLVAGGWVGLDRDAPGRGRRFTAWRGCALIFRTVPIRNGKSTSASPRPWPPVELRGRLLRLAEDIRQRARRVFAHRVRMTLVDGNNHWPRRGEPNTAVGECTIE